MTNRFSLLAPILASLLLIASCAGSRFATGTDRLFTGAKITVLSTEKPVDKRLVEKTAREALRPRPNKSFLGFYPKLWFHSLAPDSVQRGFRAWLKKTAGEPPVYMSNVNPSATAEFIDTKLFNIGIFNSATTFSLVEKERTAGVVYSCRVHPPFRVRTITYKRESDSLSQRIASLVHSSLVRVGDPYDLSLLKAERVRIDSVLKEEGYFYFNSEYLLFAADTGHEARTVDLRLALTGDVPAEARTAYRIRNITINPSYSLDRDAQGEEIDTVVVDSVTIIGTSSIKPRVIVRACALRKNRLYTRRQHNRTLSRIMSMGNFKYAAIRFTESDTAKIGGLDVEILLTPLQKRSLRSELTLVSKSNDFVGPQLKLNYSDRNVFGGAEMLNLTMSSSVEAQLFTIDRNLYSYELSPQLDYTIPRFFVPFILLNPRGVVVPKTRFSVGYNYVRRINFFDSKSLLFTYGFKWRQNRRTGHELNPVTVNYMTLTNKSQAFTRLLDTNLYLRKSYEDQFIAGSYYSYTFNEQFAPKQKNQFFFNGTTELSGNAFSAGHILFTGKSPSADQPLTVAGSIYSQFARITLDARNVTNLSLSQKLVVRLYAGAGLPYGNSATLPYSKQFFCGGPSSLRAFPINSVGPGTSIPRKGASFLEPGGDCKVEANLEYRFPLIGFLKGATFIDAGNTWLLSGTDSETFNVNRFYRELALGTGAGLRFDITLFILRLDLGVPIYKPWPSQTEVSGTFGDKSWRRRNMVWNIAIGYPF
ncbi:MAG: BamA/TamA family outer membrane protein [Chitinispirillaceae bacterium]|nr:BamA/TamA family outer membrane protein [Chitinispirillaceae bacterium]